MEAAYYRSYEVFVGCYRTLPDCDPEEAFAEVFSGRTYASATEAALRRQADGLVYEPPEDPDHARTEIFDIEIDAEGTEAAVTFCTFAGDIERAVAPDGSRTDVGLNDTVDVSWGEARLRLENDAVWRVYEFPLDVGDSVEVPLGEVEELLEEGALCGNSSVS